MNTDNLKRAAWNLVLLLLVVFPIWIILMGAYVVATDGPQGGHYLQAVLFYFLVMAIPLMMGGVAQQLVLLSLPRHWPENQRRASVIAVGLLTIPAAFLLVRSEPGLVLSAPVLGTLLIALLVYGFAVKLPT